MKIKLLLFLLVLNYFLCAQTSGKFKKITKEAYDSIPSLGSFLILKNDTILCEEYFNGADSATVFDVKSVTKSVVSALAGIAHDKGLLPDVNTPVLNVLPEYAVDTNYYKNKLTLKHLLTMQVGILWDDNNPPLPLRQTKTDDGVTKFLSQPFEVMPGTKFRYCTPGSHLLGVAVAKCVKTNLKTFGDSVLFHLLGITITNWPSDQQNRNAGGSELRLKPRDMIKFGTLFLNEGIVDGKQVISKEWIKESTNEQVKLNHWDVLPDANGYGYFWWRRKVKGHQAYVASGYGGQLICVIPDLKMIIVTTCFVNDENRGRSEIKRLHGFIDKVVKASK